MNRFVIVTAGRTGSNFVGQSLANHPNVRWWGELFNRNDPKTLALLNKHRMLLHDEGNPIDYLNTLYESPYNPAEIQTIGFKLMYTHARTTHWKCLWDYIRTDTRIIHLKRRNVLDTYLSYRLAIRENSYIAWEQDKGYDETPIRLEIADVKQAIKGGKKQARDMDFFLKSSVHMEVFYEDVVRFPVIMEEIQKFLEVHPMTLPPKTYRQRRKPKSLMIENYDELKSHFRDSQFWEFFDEE